MSGRIIHVSHYLPIVAALNTNEHSGVPTPPKTPDHEPAHALDVLTELSSITNGSAPAAAGVALTHISPRWSLSHRRGHSAMHSGIRSLSVTHEQVIIGWIGAIHLGPSSPLNSEVNTTPTDSLDNADKIILDEQVAAYHGPDDAPDAKPVSYASVWLDDATAHDHYEGYCKTTLWPLFHYLLWQDVTTELPAEDKDWNAYVRASEAYAKRVAEVYKPGDLIWIHDYHCLLVPRLLRQLIPEAFIGLFMHTPFPSSEVFRCLPSKYRCYPLTLLTEVKLF